MLEEWRGGGGVAVGDAGEIGLFYVGVYARDSWQRYKVYSFFFFPVILSYSGSFFGSTRDVFITTPLEVPCNILVMPSPTHAFRDKFVRFSYYLVMIFRLECART